MSKPVNSERVYLGHSIYGPDFYSNSYWTTYMIVPHDSSKEFWIRRASLDKIKAEIRAKA